MTHVRTTLAARWARHRTERASIREARAFRRLIAEAPTRESAHELRSLLAHR
jgi:hypothetical protein